MTKTITVDGVEYPVQGGADETVGSAEVLSGVQETAAGNVESAGAGTPDGGSAEASSGAVGKAPSDVVTITRAEYEAFVLDRTELEVCKVELAYMTEHADAMQRMLQNGTAAEPGEGASVKTDSMGVPVPAGM